MRKNQLQQVRWEKDMSLGRLSNISGISKSTISSIELGHSKNPSVWTALQLAKALHVSVEDLFVL